MRSCTDRSGVRGNVVCGDVFSVVQDCVMQQLFSVVNQFLAHSTETAKRQLALRCYKVRQSS